MSVVAPILLLSGDETKLRSLAGSSTIEAGLAQRARIVLLAAQGVSNTQIASMVGVSRPTVILWRTRYVQAGIAGLADLPRAGRPPRIDVLPVAVADRTAPSESPGVTHWSARRLAAHLGISFASVARISRGHDLLPWRPETLNTSTDPGLDAKVRDVVGLYLNPPEKAVVLVVCVDERSQTQAQGHTVAIPPLRTAPSQAATIDYFRHGRTSLFAALEVAGGKVSDAGFQRHLDVDFLDFLRLVAKAHPRVKLHVVVDSHDILNDPKVKAWLAGNPRVTVLFISTSGSWMNMVEIFFRVTTRQAIRRGTVTSVKELVKSIETFIDGWNERCKPFMWTKAADEIRAKVR